MGPMRERVFTHDAAAWARDFLHELDARPAQRPTTADGIPAMRRLLANALADGQRVAMFLDYDGTVREIVRDPAAARPTPEVRGLLNRLAAQPNVDLIVISGRTAADLTAFLGERPEFGLVAEHGAELRAPNEAAWQQLDHNLDLGWKQQAFRILELYARSTPGTHVERKRTGLVWHYRQADPEFGKWKAKQLVDELSIVSANYPVEVRHGRKIVEVAGAHVNKGTAALKIIGDRPYDLILMVGDDTTDESMFQLASGDARMVTIHIGEGDTRAQYRLTNPAAFRAFLESALTPEPPALDGKGYFDRGANALQQVGSASYMCNG
jgi:trehalose 6-phosphate synthase/phosphatase